MDECIKRAAAVKAVLRERKPENSVAQNRKLSIIQRELLIMPAADVAPVVHGQWDKNGNCTNCGKHAPFWSVSSCYYKSPYCQSCGAKMDGGPDK